MNIHRVIILISSCFTVLLAGCSHYTGPVAARAPAQYCAGQVYAIHGDSKSTFKAGEHHRPIKVAMGVQNYKDARCAVHAR